jgi:hypothetical protein
MPGKHLVYPFLEESTSQRLAEALIQGVHPQILDWHTGFPGRAELAATFGLAEAEPVGGVLAGAAETRSFDAGLEQHRAVCVDVLPVSGKLGEGATGIQKVAAHRRPAERQQDVQRQPGQLLVGTVAIADDDGLLRLQPGKMRAGDCGTAAGVDAVDSSLPGR